MRKFLYSDKIYGVGGILFGYELIEYGDIERKKVSYSTDYIKNGILSKRIFVDRLRVVKDEVVLVDDKSDWIAMISANREKKGLADLPDIEDKPAKSGKLPTHRKKRYKYKRKH